MPYLSLEDMGFKTGKKPADSNPLSAVPREKTIVGSIAAGKGLGGWQGPAAAKVFGGTPGAVNYGSMLSGAAAGGF